MITLMFDDGVKSEYTLAKPLFDKFNFVGCTCVTSNYVGTLDYLKESSY